MAADTRGLEARAAARWNRAATEAVRFAVVPRLRENYGRLPYASGETARKIRFRRRSGPPVIGFDIEAPTPQAEWREKGTRPHIIVPVRARTLRFYWPKVGRVVYAHRVKHPGQRARPTFTRTITQAWREYLRGALRRA